MNLKKNVITHTIIYQIELEENKTIDEIKVEAESIEAGKVFLPKNCKILSVKETVNGEGK